jgi:hypothetical protein
VAAGVKRVEVEWHDSTKIDMGWDTLDAYRAEAHVEVTRSLGYVVEEKADSVVVAQSWQPSNQGGKVADVVVIPRSDIRSIRELRTR